MNDLRNIPSIDSLLNHPDVKEFLMKCGRVFVKDALKVTVEIIREESAKNTIIPDSSEIILRTKSYIRQSLSPTLIPVINATGVIIHTNLGRAPFSEDTLKAMQSVSSAYSNLEFNLENGKRGKRSIHAEELLRKLTGAENALVVNNNAAAVLLILTALAYKKRVIISRTQLVEIGGGFRVPEVMKQSGAKLEGIGTTNRVHLYDYENALKEPAGVVMCTHPSNFRILGFTGEPTVKQISVLAHKKNITFVYDLGSGALLNTEKYGLAHEPTVQEALKDGADIVCFSGDKLLGGPQAGIIIGKKGLLDKIKKHPLARAVRADKLCLAGITATLLHYIKGEAEHTVPVWKMISAQKEGIRTRAQKYLNQLQIGNLLSGQSMVGGGSLPGETLPTTLFSLKVSKPNIFLVHMRQQPVPIIARIENGQVVCDPRTIFPEQDDLFINEMRTVLTDYSK